MKKCAYGGNSILFCRTPIGTHKFIDKNLCANADGRAAGEWIDLSLRSHQAADCSGRSTNSHSERPLHLWHRGKLASLSSATSSPQHSEAYSPGSITSCPVFISPSLPCRGLSYTPAHLAPNRKFA